MNVPFEHALYRTRCKTCNELLDWEADFDADSPSYSASCCHLEYFMKPATMTVTWEREDDCV